MYITRGEKMAEVINNWHKNKHQLFPSISFIKYEEVFAYWVHNFNKEKIQLNILLRDFFKS